jgi:CHAD domain-containing protein
VAPLIVGNCSKAERGFALYRGAPAAPQKAESSPVTAQMSSSTAFKALVASCLAHFLANQHGLLNSRDPEYLHQMRVAMRRLRSAFAIFAPLFPEQTSASLVAETRWLITALGRARDWDVFDIEVLPPLAERYADHRGFEAIRRVVTRLRGRARRTARHAVVSGRGQGLMLKLGLWLSAEEQPAWVDDAQRMALAQPVEQFAQIMLATAYARVLERGRYFGRLTPRRLHRLRIAAKKLRYAVDFFGPLYDPQRVKHFRAALTSLQDALGTFNDAVTMAQLVERASRTLKTGSAKEARGIILGWSGGTQHTSVGHMKLLWKKVRTIRPFWGEA